MKTTRNPHRHPTRKLKKDARKRSSPLFPDCGSYYTKICSHDLAAAEHLREQSQY